MLMRAMAVGLWAPGVADGRVWLTGRHSDVQGQPAAAILPPMVRRRSSFLTRMLADVFAQITTTTDRSSVASVYASAYGETGALADLLDQLAIEGELSPIRFCGSVHNAASGQISIVCENKALTTSIAAGRHTVAMALLEAQSLLADGIEQVAVVCGDVLPPPTLCDARFAPLAAGLLLRGGPPDGTELGLLRDLLADDMLTESIALNSAQWSNPCSGALVLVDTLLRTTSIRVGLSPVGQQGWGIDVVAASGLPLEVA
ncbi:MAG: hypothetical protein EXR77_19685 [Myxococcales bacterium]|nr:hypothetical protein [Myxococcales bacterium]